MRGWRCMFGISHQSTLHPHFGIIIWIYPGRHSSFCNGFASSHSIWEFRVITVTLLYETELSRSKSNISITKRSTFVGARSNIRHGIKRTIHLLFNNLNIALIELSCQMRHQNCISWSSILSIRNRRFPFISITLGMTQLGFRTFHLGSDKSLALCRYVGVRIFYDVWLLIIKDSDFSTLLDWRKVILSRVIKWVALVILCISPHKNPI